MYLFQNEVDKTGADADIIPFQTTHAQQQVYFFLVLADFIKPLFFAA
jgi:hypothetical protein